MIRRGNLQEFGDFTWRVYDCEELVGDEIQLPVQSVIRTFLAKKLWRPERLFPGNCMDKLLLNADKNADKWGVAFANPAIARDCENG